jgi:twitching motility protein PilT
MYDQTSLEKIMKYAVEHKASDIHITVGKPPMLRINGVLNPIPGNEDCAEKDTFTMLNTIMDTKRRTQFFDDGETDFSYELPGFSRFRVNIYKQSGCVAGALRLISSEIPTFEQLHLPDVLRDLAMLPRGLILVTGPTGSGKSTTLAAMINLINHYRKAHIITLEDPVEYKHKHLNSIIDQREIGGDTKSFFSGLRAALREDPDVILVGEMRDPETIGTAITAAETGHLVFATLHTLDAASTVNRIIDVFPDQQQQQIRVQLSGNLQGIVAQQLLMNREKTDRVAAFEILVATPALRNLIREGKTHQIPSYIQTGHNYGMVAMDAYLADLVNKRLVDKDVAEERCYNPLTFERYLQGI